MVLSAELFPVLSDLANCTVYRCPVLSSRFQVRVFSLRGLVCVLPHDYPDRSVSLRTCYAMSGTELAYGVLSAYAPAMQCPAELASALIYNVLGLSIALASSLSRT
eukprot:481646-Rhodomonas_salina.4